MNTNEHEWERSLFIVGADPLREARSAASVRRLWFRMEARFEERFEPPYPPLSDYGAASVGS
jgi:hypothetical protein